MAKGTTKTAPAPAPVASNSPFAIIEDNAPPPAREFGGGRSAEDNPYRKAALELKAPTADGKHYAYQVPVSVPDTITDAGEKAKAIKEASRKLVNSIGGVTRRITKNDANMAFVVRPVESGGQHFVKVWRVKPKAPAAA